jgi:hypothetical protein
MKQYVKQAFLQEVRVVQDERDVKNDGHGCPLNLNDDMTNQNLIQVKIKRRLNSGNACYHSVQNLLSSSLLSKYIKIRIYKTIILPVVLYG